MLSDNVSMKRSLTLPIIAAMSLASATASAASHVTCVGDSITFGVGTANPPTTGYPAKLQALLGASFDVQNEGHSGATLLHDGDLPYINQPEYANATTWAAAGGDVVIQLGTNDAKPQNWANKASFEGDCEALVAALPRRAATAGRRRRACGSTSRRRPSRRTRMASPTGRSCGEVIPLLRQCATAKGVSTIDIHDALSDFSADFADGVHPNDDGAGKIAQAVHDALVKLPTISLSATAVSYPSGAPVVVNTTAHRGLRHGPVGRALRGHHVARQGDGRAVHRVDQRARRWHARALRARDGDGRADGRLVAADSGRGHGRARRRHEQRRLERRDDDPVGQQLVHVGRIVASSSRDAQPSERRLQRRTRRRLSLRSASSSACSCSCSGSSGPRNSDAGNAAPRNRGFEARRTAIDERLERRVRMHRRKIVRRDSCIRLATGSS